MRESMRKSYLAVYESERAKEAAERLSPGRPKKDDGKSTSNLMQINSEKPKRNPTTAAEVAKKIGVSENTYRPLVPP